MTTTTDGQQVRRLGRYQAGLSRLGSIRKFTQRAARLDGVVEDNSSLISGEKFDFQNKKEILNLDTVSFTTSCMPSPDGKTHLDGGHIAAKPVASPSARVVQETRVDVAALLAETAALRKERDAARAERDLIWTKLEQALRATNAKNVAFSALEAQVSRLKRPRVTVDSNLNNESNDARNAAALSFKLLDLRAQGLLDFYKPDTMGRNARHPDHWIVEKLERLVQAGYLTAAELLLSLRDPGVWFKADEKLCRAKAKRNSRGSKSEPLDALQLKLSAADKIAQRTKSTRKSTENAMILLVSSH